MKRTIIGLIMLMGIAMVGRVEATHRVEIRQGQTGQEFYDTSTGRKFIPRGASYIRQAELYDPWAQQNLLSHSVFHVGSYDRVKAETALKQMHEWGYNLVRVFVIPVNGDDVEAGGVGVADQFWKNVADFLTLAKENDLVVTLVFSRIPKLGYDFANSIGDFRENNWYYLTADGIRNKKKFLEDAIRGIKKWNGPLEQIFSYEENEVYFLNDKPPLSYTSGKITTANGKSYDMAVESERRAMMNEGVNYWLGQLKLSIQTLDPGAMVAPSFFSQAAVPGGEAWIVPEVDKINGDYIDVHAYSGWLDSDLKKDLQKTMAPFQLVNASRRPIVMGEFGTDKRQYPQGIMTAIEALKNWQVESCVTYGFGGWILWEWDDETQTHFWNAVDEGGVVGQALSPKIRDNPCMVAQTTPVEIKVGDVNQDGKVDLLDFSLWKQEYSKKVTTRRADFNNDGIVNLVDFSIWKREYSRK